MAKRVQFLPDQARHLPDRDAIELPATVDGAPVRCLVTAELLIQRFGARNNTPTEVLGAFNYGLLAIEEALRKLIEASDVDANGEVVLTPKNFTPPLTLPQTAPPAPPAAPLAVGVDPPGGRRYEGRPYTRPRTHGCRRVVTRGRWAGRFSPGRPAPSVHPLAYGAGAGVR